MPTAPHSLRACVQAPIFQALGPRFGPSGGAEAAKQAKSSRHLGPMEAPVTRDGAKGPHNRRTCAASSRALQPRTRARRGPGASRGSSPKAACKKRMPRAQMRSLGRPEGAGQE